MEDVQRLSSAGYRLQGALIGQQLSLRQPAMVAANVEPVVAALAEP